MRLREYIKVMIKERRQEMEKPDFQSKGDFLTILLESEFFMNQDEMIIDECAVFMVAAT